MPVDGRLHSASQARGRDVEVTSQATHNGRGQVTLNGVETTQATTTIGGSVTRGGSDVQTAPCPVLVRSEGWSPPVTEDGERQGDAPGAGGSFLHGAQRRPGAGRSGELWRYPHPGYEASPRPQLRGQRTDHRGR